MLTKYFSRGKIDILGFLIIFLNKKKRGFSSIELNKKSHIDQSVTTKTYREFKTKKKYYISAIKLVLCDLNYKNILDISCGVGVLCELLIKQVQSINLFAYDFSESCINIVRSNIGNKVQCKIHNIYDPLTEKFDIIFCTETIEHLLYPEKALINILNGLAEGGTAIITVPNGKLDTYENHIYFWSIDSWGVFLNKYVDKTIYDITYGFFYQEQRHMYVRIVKRLKL